MAITLHASTPAAVLNGGNVVTTSSFTPPAGALLIAKVSDNNDGPSSRAIVISDNHTDDLGWTELGVTDYVETEVGSSHVSIWWGRVTSSTAMTVTSTASAGGGSHIHSLKVEVWQGDNTSSPIGSVVVKGTETSPVQASYTAGAIGSQGTSAYLDWAAGSVPTSSDQTGLEGAASGSTAAFARQTTQAASISTQTMTYTASGSSLNMVAVEILPAALAPDAPVLVLASEGDTRIYLDWTVPADNGAAITDYIIETSPNGTTGWSTISDGTSTAHELLLTGQTNGVAQYFRVSAVNSIGTGAVSNVMGPVTPRAAADFIDIENGDAVYVEDGDELALEED